MAWTAPRTWVTSEVVTSSIMNTHVRDNLLANSDAVLARRTTTQTTSPFDVSFDTETFDDFSAFAIGTPTKITLSAAGRYEIRWWATPTGGTDGNWSARVRRYNSGAALQEDDIAGFDGGYTAVGSGAGLVVASASDYLTVYFQSAAAGSRCNLGKLSIYVRKAQA